MTFNIYREEMDGSGYLIAVITAGTKEEALSEYFNKNRIRKSERWLYYATSKEKDDKNKALLRELGYSSWDEYYADMHPERPIEL